MPNPVSELRKIRVHDIDMAYRLEGNPDGPVVMMAHAMGTSHRIWDWQVPVLEKEYSILRYDWRGHGDTDAPPGPYSLLQFEQDAVGLMDALDIDQVHWVGISTGGMIGQGLGINAGERLKSLLLCNTISQANEGYREWVAERQAVLEERGMDDIWEMTHRLWFTDAFVEQAGEAYQTIKEVFVNTPVAGYLGGTTAVSFLAYRDFLSEITVPTSIIGAGDDPVTPVNPQSTDIAERIIGADLAVIEGQRHFSNVEVPDEFNALMLDALRRHT